MQNVNVIKLLRQHRIVFVVISRFVNISSESYSVSHILEQMNLPMRITAPATNLSLQHQTNFTLKLTTFDRIWLQINSTQTYIQIRNSVTMVLKIHIERMRACDFDFPIILSKYRNIPSGIRKCGRLLNHLCQLQPKLMFVVDANEPSIQCRFGASRGLKLSTDFGGPFEPKTIFRSRILRILFLRSCFVLGFYAFFPTAPRWPAHSIPP